MINIRSVYKQDKAISIGLWMTLSAIFVYIIGKIVYQFVLYSTCQHWGNAKTTCHLHYEKKLGNYLCYLTILFLFLCLLFKIGVWFFCKKLQLYEEVEGKNEEAVEIRELMAPVSASEQTDAPTNGGKYLFHKRKGSEIIALGSFSFES